MPISIVPTPINLNDSLPFPGPGRVNGWFRADRNNPRNVTCSLPNVGSCGTPSPTTSSPYTILQTDRGTLLVVNSTAGSGAVTVKPPAAVAAGEWKAHTNYILGAKIIDPSSHLQQVTGPGISGDTEPAPPTNPWNDSGGTTTDGSVIWQDEGIAVTLDFMCWIENRGSDDLIVQPVLGSIDGGSSITLHQNQGFTLFCDALGDYHTETGTFPSTQPYDMWMFFPGVYTASQTLFSGTFPRAVSFPANMAGSYGSVLANPSSSATVTASFGGHSITISITTGGAVSFSNSAFTTAAGDAASITAPSSADATLAGLGLTLVGSR